MDKYRSYYNKIKVCIICEGYEEYEYFDRLIKLNIFNKVYDINLVNAKGNGNIFARYQDIYQQNKYHLIFIFCDTEKKPYEQFNDIKNKIDEFYDHKGISDKIVIFANPCTMQIILLHFGEIIIKSNQKSKNAEDIEKMTGIKGYNASEEKRNELFNKITKDNYIEENGTIYPIEIKMTTKPSLDMISAYSVLKKVKNKNIGNAAIICNVEELSRIGDSIYAVPVYDI